MLAKPAPHTEQAKFILLNVDINMNADAWATEGITEADLRRCSVEAFNASQRLCGFDRDGISACEIAILITTDAKLQSLNLQFRGMDKPTNVLSFNALNVKRQSLMDGQPLFLGDIAIATETVMREAHEQNKKVADHLSHMIIHGTLHLLGYDHEDEDEAKKMEALERRILASLNIADPYGAMG
jgi:probable rRNA maturation factor